MDTAYDNIQKEALPLSQGESSENKEETPAPTTTLNSDFSEAYKAISSSPWGARLGGFFGNVVKQVIAYGSARLCAQELTGYIGRICLQGSIQGAHTSRIGGFSRPR